MKHSYKPSYFWSTSFAVREDPSITLTSVWGGKNIYTYFILSDIFPWVLISSQCSWSPQLFPGIMFIPWEIGKNSNSSNTVMNLIFGTTSLLQLHILQLGKQYWPLITMHTSTSHVYGCKRLMKICSRQWGDYVQVLFFKLCTSWYVWTAMS